VEIIILAGLIAGTVWIVWKSRAQGRASSSATLQQAWKIVLSDPHYKHRREHEEHMHELEKQLQKEAENL
jgi:hypothetical protein